MKKAVLVSLIAVFGALLFSSIVSARSSYLSGASGVNTVCGTNYDCDFCHANQNNETTWTASGACGFCPNDADCAVAPTCTDADRDGYNAEGGDCGAIDCNDNNSAVNPGASEACSNNIDDDCDGRVDCGDANCAGNAACAGICVPTVGNERKACTGGADDDCDGAIDCADSDCRSNSACVTATCTPEGKGRTCSDGKDNDCDGLSDCADPDCTGNRSCR